MMEGKYTGILFLMILSYGMYIMHMIISYRLSYIYSHNNSLLPGERSQLCNH